MVYNPKAHAENEKNETKKGYGKPETCHTNQTEKGSKNFKVGLAKQLTPHTLPQMRKNNHPQLIR